MYNKEHAGKNYKGNIINKLKTKSGFKSIR